MEGNLVNVLRDRLETYMRQSNNGSTKTGRDTFTHWLQKLFIQGPTFYRDDPVCNIKYNFFLSKKKKSLHINGHKFYLLRRQTTKINYNNECYKELKN